MTSGKKTILVMGATGTQGGAVVRHLDGKGFQLRAMTRKPDSEKAQALRKAGVEVLKGDFDDDATLGAALDGAWGAFAVQNTWEAGVEAEEKQGKRVAKLARERGVQHFVYTSVGSAHLKTGIPHFDNKARVEETVRGLGFPSYAIIRPVFFMENLASPWFLKGDKIVTALAPTTRLQMIASDDIGAFGALAFEQAAQWNGRAVDIAGDTATMPEVAAIFSEVLRKKIEFMQIPIEGVRQNSADFAAMLEWFDKVGYSADIEGLKKAYGLPRLRLVDWARANLKP